MRISFVLHHSCSTTVAQWRWRHNGYSTAWNYTQTTSYSISLSHCVACEFRACQPGKLAGVLVGRRLVLQVEFPWLRSMCITCAAAASGPEAYGCYCAVPVLRNQVWQQLLLHWATVTCSVLDSCPAQSSPEFIVPSVLYDLGDCHSVLCDRRSVLCDHPSSHYASCVELDSYRSVLS